ncbi:hypothetical protein FQN49_007093 [Arthroderma sp. PD_2]|nr:hypothetical protein FQN49_007093 [Arthroderma sp. PD_2]
MFVLRGVVPRLNLPVPIALALIYTFFVAPLFLLLYYEIKGRQQRAHTPKGCRKLGLHDNISNLNDEAEYGPNGLKKDSTDKTARVKALIVYPIKSCKGIEFNRAEFEDSGLAWDRKFCFAEYTKSRDEDGVEKDEGRWDAKTLRDGKYSRMALIRPEIWVPDPSSESYDARLRSVKSGGILIVYFPRDTSSLPFWTKLGISIGLLESEEFFSLPLNPPKSEDQASAYPLEPIRLFGVPTKGTQYTTHVPSSLSRFLESKKPLSLFRVHPSHDRVAVGNAPTKAELGFTPAMAFSDQYPLQVQNLGSLRDMSGRTSYAIPHLSVRRFRPNIVVEGVGAYEEDAWKMIRIVPEEKGEEVDIHVSCRTVRCRLPNVDPDTGERHLVEPDKTLRGTRAIDEGANGGGCLGMMLVPTKSKFTIRVGDEVKVLSTGEHFYKAK